MIVVTLFIALFEFRMLISRSVYLCSDGLAQQTVSAGRSLSATGR